MHDADEDVRLMLALRAGDTSAFDALFRRWSGPLLRFVDRMVRDPAAAEELVQETFLRLYKARERYEDYGRARDAMFEATHTKHAPWFVVEFDDQRRGRLNLIRHLLDLVPDRKLPIEPLELPPLPGKPAKERYDGPVKPIEGRY